MAILYEFMKLIDIDQFENLNKEFYEIRSKFSRDVDEEYW